MAAEAGDKPMSVADALVKQLQDGIMRGEFAVGSSLPSERELMSLYQVGRTTVREALRVLGAQGLLNVRRGRTGGSYISSPGSQSVVQSLDLFIKGQGIRYIDLVYAREAIEPSAAAQAALSRSADQLAAMDRACTACNDTVDDAASFVRANLHWHLTVVEASNNPLFTAFLTSISAALDAATNMEEFDVVTRRTVARVHRQIVTAIRDGDPDAARRRMFRHLTAYGERLSSIDLSARAHGVATP